MAFFIAIGFHKPHLAWPVTKHAWERSANVSPGVPKDERVKPARASSKFCFEGEGKKSSGMPGRGQHSSAILTDGRAIDFAEGGDCDGPLGYYPALQDDGAVRELRRAYFSALSSTDDLVGKVLDGETNYITKKNYIIFYITCNIEYVNVTRNNHCVHYMLRTEKLHFTCHVYT